MPSLLAKFGPRVESLVDTMTDELAGALGAWFGTVVDDLVARAIPTRNERGARRGLRKALDSVRERFTGVFRDMWSDGASESRAATIGRYSLDADGALTDAAIQDALRENGARAAQQVETRIVGDLAESLVEAHREGLSVDEIADRLRRDVFPDMLSWESERIARTEVTAAANKGALTAFEDAGVPGKRWAAIDDPRTRRTHAHADGQTTLLKASFFVGGHRCDYPGDPTLPVGERVNCRCRALPVFDIADV